MECVDVDRACLADGKKLAQTVHALLQQPLLPFRRVAHLVSPVAEDVRAVLLACEHVRADILLEERTVVVCVEEVHVQAHRRVVLLRLPHEPPDAVERIRVARAGDGPVALEEGGVLGVVSVVLPAHEIDDLRKPERERVHALDHLKRLFAAHVDLLFAVVAHLVFSKMHRIELRLREEEFRDVRLRVVVAGMDRPLEVRLFERIRPDRPLKREHVHVRRAHRERRQQNARRGKGNSTGEEILH